MMKNVLQTTLSVTQSIVPDHDGSRLIRVDSIFSSDLRQVFPFDYFNLMQSTVFHAAFFSNGNMVVGGPLDKLRENSRV